MFRFIFPLLYFVEHIIFKFGGKILHQRWIMIFFFKMGLLWISPWTKTKYFIKIKSWSTKYSEKRHARFFTDLIINRTTFVAKNELGNLNQNRKNGNLTKAKAEILKIFEEVGILISKTFGYTYNMDIFQFVFGRVG